MNHRRALAGLLLFTMLPACAPEATPNSETPPTSEATATSSTAVSPSTAATPSSTAAPAPTRSVTLRSLLGDPDEGEVANSVIGLDDGGFLVAGYDYVDANDDGAWDALVMRVGPDGDTVWRHSSDREASEYAWVVREAGEGRFLVAGAWESDAGDHDAYTQLFDADGNDVGITTYGGSGDEIVWGAEPTDDGGFFLVGESDSEGAGGLDCYVVRTDADGRELWSRTYGTVDIDRAFGIGVTPDGGALIAGFTGPDTATMNFFFVRIDAEGRERWRRTIAGDRFDVAHDVLRLVDGGYVISGYTSSYGPSQHDGFLMQLTESGRMLWMKTYDLEGGDDRILHVAQTTDGGFAAIGFTDGDTVVWRMDPAGDLLWTLTDGGSSFDVGKDIIVTGDGSIVAVGGNRSDHPPRDDVLLLVIDE